jgi:hypothetical protein
MAIDTPARIAVLGAGPIGLEAALYARYLGYDVDIYERDVVAQHVRDWGHARMFSPFGMNRSPLGLAALKAQDASYQPPGDDQLLTGREFADRYLIPLSQSDLLIDNLHERTEVVAVGRDGLLPGDMPGEEGRGDYNFRLLLRRTDPDDHGRQRIADADVVIDASGCYRTHNWLGHGGIPAVGEEAAAAHIEYGLPDVLGAGRDEYASRNILLVGDGYSAAATLVSLAELAAHAPDTWITWLSRVECDRRAPQPIEPMASDPLPERQRLTRMANALAADDANHVSLLDGTTVDAVSWHGDRERFTVTLLGKHAGELEFDRIVGNVGYHADHALHAALGVSVFEPAQRDLLDPKQALLGGEPNFYILGAKSFGHDSRFLISHGLEQIRELFAVIGDRAELDLYSTMAGLH